MSANYDYYNDRENSGYFHKFVERNPEFQNGGDFREFVIAKNKGDRDSGELSAIAPHEVLRLAKEYAEYQHRFGYTSDWLEGDNE